MPSPINIASNALVLIGDEPISSFADPGAGPRAAASLFWDTYSQVLSSFPWSFALRTLPLGRLLSPSDVSEYQFVFQLPSNLLRVWETLPRTVYQVAGSRLYSNEPELTIQYVQIMDPGTLPPQFTKALEYRLAADLAMLVTESQNKAQYYDQKFEHFYQSAKLTDIAASGSLFDDTYDQMLSSHPWSFALRTVDLTRLAERPPDGVPYENVFPLPGDMVKLLEVIPRSTYQIVGERIYTNEFALAVQYISRVDRSACSPQFHKALALTRMAEVAAASPVTRGEAPYYDEQAARHLQLAKDADTEQSGMLFNDSFHQMLGSHPWSFATNVVDLTRLTEPISELSPYSAVFPLPGDMVRLLEVLPRTSYQIVGNRIYTNEPALTVQYIAQVEIHDCSPQFIRALEYRRMGEEKASSPATVSEAPYYQQLYEQHLQIAKDADTFQAGVLFDDTFHQLLASHPWSFSLKVVELTRAEDSPAEGSPYGNAFSLPSDMVRLLEVLPRSSYQIVGKQLHSDEQALTVQYISQVEIHDCSTQFIKALEYKRMAEEKALSPATSGEAPYYQGLHDQYIQIAKDTDAEQAGVLFDDTLHQMLSCHPWSFAVRVEDLGTAIPTSSLPPYRHSFMVPDDFLRLLEVIPRSTYQVVGNQIFSSEDFLTIQYVAAVDVHDCSPQFIKALEYKRMAEMKALSPLMKADAPYYEQLYEQQLQVAKDTDTEQSGVLFQDTFRQMLMSYPWSFATRLAELSVGSSTVPGFLPYKNVFEFPSGLLKLLDVLPRCSYQIIGNQLYTDEDSVSIQYIADIEIHQCPPQFVKAFEHRQQAEIAARSVANKAEAPYHEGLSAQYLQFAKDIDAQHAGDLFQDTYHQVLSTYPWSFATVVAPAQHEDEPIPEALGWQFVYSLPEDMLRLWEVIPYAPYEIVGERLYANASRLTYRYISTARLSLAPPQFHKALEYKKLAEQAIASPAEQGKVSYYEQQHQYYLQLAKTIDSQNRPQQSISHRPYTDIRFGGGAYG